MAAQLDDFSDHVQELIDFLRLKRVYEKALNINIPGIDLEQAKAFTQKVHQVCPYSNATRNNIEVELITTNHD